MSRTRRIYNKRPIYGGPGYRGIVISYRGYYEDDSFWTVYHPYRQICMGHCPSCKRQWEQEAIERKQREKRYAELEILNSDNMEYRIRRAIEVRREQGAETDYDLYEMISDHPGSNSYELAKLMGWTTGRTRSAIYRLEQKRLIKVERTVHDGRNVLSAVPKPWQEFLTPEELEEFWQMEL